MIWITNWSKNTFLKSIIFPYLPNQLDSVSECHKSILFQQKTQWQFDKWYNEIYKNIV